MCSPWPQDLSTSRNIPSHGRLSTGRTRMAFPRAVVTEFVALTGAGAKAVFQGVPWYIGSPSLFTDLGLMNERVSPYIEQLQAQGKTVVLVGNPSAIYGLLALQDQCTGVRETIAGCECRGPRRYVNRRQ